MSSCGSNCTVTNYVFYLSRRVQTMSSMLGLVFISTLFSLNPQNHSYYYMQFSVSCFYLIKKKSFHTNVGHDHIPNIPFIPQRKMTWSHIYGMFQYNDKTKYTAGVSLLYSTLLVKKCLMQHILPWYSVSETLWWHVQQICVTFAISVFSVSLKKQTTSQKQNIINKILVCFDINWLLKVCK